MERNCNTQRWEAEKNDDIIVEMIMRFSFDKNLRDAHGKILVSVTSEENIAAKCNSSKELFAIDFGATC
jgi:hypothetical protein